MKNYIQDDDVIEFTFAGAHSSGDPICVGQVSGVFEVDCAATASAAIRIEGVISVSVRGWDGSSGATINIGDPVYYTSSDTPVLNVRTAGTLYGYAVDPVVSGSTTTIRVLLKH